jgi:hypothetical protein
MKVCPETRGRPIIFDLTLNCDRAKSDGRGLPATVTCIDSGFSGARVHRF